MWEHKHKLYLAYHTAVISVLMSKLKAARSFGDLKSKVKVINEVKVKVIQKMKIAGNWLKRVENLKSHFQNFHINLTFFCGLCGHFVVAEHWCRGAMYVHASRYLLSQV